MAHNGQPLVRYNGLTSGYSFAEKMPEADYTERKVYFPIAFIRPRYGDAEKNGYEAVRTSHSRGGAIEITGRWV